MSCSSNSHTAEPEPAAATCARRTVVLSLAATLSLGLPTLARADAPLEGLRRWGSGEYRRFGFLLYEATLWAGDDPQRPPLALRLDYKRRIAGSAIAEASVAEMRRFVADEARVREWGEPMRRIFPDVKAGDHLVGVHRGDEARFYQDGRLLGAIASPGFAAAFFAIWLDERTSAPQLRTALLRGRGP